MSNNRIKELREKRGLSTTELANELGFFSQSILSYENRGVKPKKERAKKIADFFGVSVEYLFGEGNDFWPGPTIEFEKQKSRGDDLYKRKSQDQEEQDTLLHSERAYTKIKTFMGDLENIEGRINHFLENPEVSVMSINISFSPEYGPGYMVERYLGVLVYRYNPLF